VLSLVFVSVIELEFQSRFVSASQLEFE